MHEHRVSETVVLGHPLVRINLPRFLKGEGISEDWRGFLKQGARFVYPRTFWLKWVADEADDAFRRQELDPEKGGLVLNKWLRESGFRGVVLDLRGVTILDPKSMLSLVQKVQAGLDFFYYVDDGGAVNLMRKTLKIPDDSIFSHEADVIRHLRDPSRLQIRNVILPEELSLSSLDEALRNQTSHSNLCGFDAVAFDFSKVKSVDFQALSMLTPIIHSMAHEHGVLASVSNPRKKILRMMLCCSALRPVASYLVSNSECFRRLGEDLPGQLAMKAFTDNERFEIYELWESKLKVMIETYKEWFRSLARVSDSTAYWRIQGKGQIIREFRQIIKELAENVSMHAYGIGYLMAQIEPPKGFSIFIGDTGDGLMKGINSKYNLNVRSDKQAVEMSLRLSEFLHRRKRTHGSLSYGGLGLERVRLILQELAGHVSVRSGTAMAVFGPGTSRRPQEVTSGLFYVQGTHVHIFIPTRPQVAK